MDAAEVKQERCPSREETLQVAGGLAQALAFKGSAFANAFMYGSPLPVSSPAHSRTLPLFGVPPLLRLKPDRRP
jgi:hypothetical protein